jgi:spatacsin
MLPCWFPKAVRRLVQLYIQVSISVLSVVCALLSCTTLLQLSGIEDLVELNTCTVIGDITSLRISMK